MHKIALVSVIITTCNRCNLLARAIKSVINQTYKNLEIIVIDDCSVDNTEEVIEQFKKLDSRIIHIKNSTRSGANVSRNKGICIANGEFIAGLDDDDEFLPNRVQLLLENYDDSFSFVTSNNLIVSNTKSITSIPQRVRLKDMLANNIVYNQGLIKKQRILDVGCYDEKLTACQDYDLWMRLMLKYGDVKVIKPATQSIYANHEFSRISSQSKNKFKGYFCFYKKYKYLMNRFERQQHLFRIYRIRAVCDKGHNALARKLLMRKLKYSEHKRISIFAVGAFLEEIYADILDMGVSIDCLVDTNATEKSSFKSREVILPKQAFDQGATCFLIASVYFYNEIVEQLHFVAEQKGVKIQVISL